MGTSSTTRALAEVGTLVLAGTGVVVAVGAVASLVAADRSGLALAALLAVALLATLSWPTAWAALLAGRVRAAAVAGVLGVLASLAVPAFHAAGTGSSGDAWRTLVMPAVVGGALVLVAVRSGRGPDAALGPARRGPALLGAAVLVVAVSVVLDAAATRSGAGLGAVLDVSSSVLGLVLAGVGLGAARRLGPARVRALGLLLVVGPALSQVTLAIGAGAGAATTLLRWVVLVVLLGLAVALLVRGAATPRASSAAAPPPRPATR